ncbi:hypothetical protein KZX15_07460 [Micrococcus luteus]|uniref:hypothetical protein n=1 Tax=Micrococcus luteus TaxID=1270 RepID=UPI002002FB82|nr:hypothetical protein [Micrococcus luteus]MCK6214205.1 hypothetical protein [Micrococcus luteus]
MPPVPDLPACLEHLGAAFGTKYLYFLTKAHRESDIAPSSTPWCAPGSPSM